MEHTSPVYREAPEYPAGASKQNVEGYVQLSFDIEKDGSVTSASVIKSVPDGVFDEAALKAISKWRYHSPLEKQHNVKVQLDFVLGNEGAKSTPKYEGTEIIEVTAK